MHKRQEETHNTANRKPEKISLGLIKNTTPWALGEYKGSS